MLCLLAPCDYKRLHMKTRLRRRITQLRRHRAGIARKAAAGHAFLICILAHMRAARLRGKALAVIGLHRAGLQAGLLYAT